MAMRKLSVIVAKVGGEIKVMLRNRKGRGRRGDSYRRRGVVGRVCLRSQGVVGGLLLRKRSRGKVGNRIYVHDVRSMIW